MSVLMSAGPSTNLNNHSPLTPNEPLTITSAPASTTVTLYLPPSSFLTIHRPKNPFSLLFRTKFHKPIPASHLYFSTEFPSKVSHLLPPGFSLVERSARWITGDPGMKWDLYAEEPWVRGWAVTSFNAVSVGSEGIADEDVREKWDGVEIGGEMVPEEESKRKKFFVGKEAEGWEVPEDKEIVWEFSNGFLDFKNGKLRLPGFDIDCKRFWAGKPLRYVLFYDPGDGSEREVIASVAFRLQDAGSPDSESKIGTSAEVKLNTPADTSTTGTAKELDDID